MEMTAEDHTEHWRSRLLELVNVLKAEHKMNQREIADKAGIAPSYLSRLLLEADRPERRNLGGTMLAKIATAFGLQPMWFDQPNGHNLDAITPEPGSYRLGYITSLNTGFASPKLLTEDSNVKPAAIGLRRIPVISEIQAGIWTEIVDTFQPGDAEEWIYTDLELSHEAFALDIVGYSMMPEFLPGHRVIIDPRVAPRPGDFVAARNGDNKATFKKYRPRGINAAGQDVFELVPLNDDYPTLSSALQPIQVIGTMMEHRKYRPK